MPLVYRKFYDMENLNPEPVFNLLREANIVVLENESVLVDIKECKLRVTGLGDYFIRRFRPRHAMAGIQDSYPHIVLAHEPNVRKFIPDFQWDLLLAGHLHGGQILLPFVGYSHIHKMFGKKYIHGLYKWRDRHIHVSAGVGATGDIRIGVPPEVTLIVWGNPDN